MPTAKPQPAQVGLSLSRGASEDYGRNKLEVAVWVTAPSGDAPAEVQQTWDTLHQLALEELDSRWNQTFDHIFGEDGES